jgi:putative endonuclease
MFVTYILFSAKINKFYTGQTSDLIRRLEEHNRGKTAFMSGGAPWELLFSKEFNTRQEAIQLEKIIKKRGASRFLTDNKNQLA